ncbi:hypothetical protein MAL08_02855 [Leptospira noguchii]|uniref:hypothetical protein n=1 Tax=Leptospira noguchii TaxID=28182 RepID=UPI001FB8225C|nr:hypothetical protein [Leptospira noguchii]UOG38299.1 hypothetical protein MAL08_02855 [Leptospira noguchii]
MNELNVSLLRSFEVTQRLTPRTQQNAFYESVLGRSTGRVGSSSYWYFIKIESDSGISQ